MTDGLTQLLRAAKAELGDGVTAEDIADAAWLAQWLTPGPPADPHPGSLEPPDLEGRSDPPTVTRPPKPKPPPLAPASTEDQAPGPIDPDRAPPVAAGLPAAPGFEAGAGQVFGARAAPALSNPLALARALRPLARRVPSRTRFDLDTDATIHRFADERVLTPVLRAVPERWLRLALVADGGVGGELWRDAVREFRTVLVNVGAFRDVRVWSLDADGPEPRVAPFGSEGPATRHPDELLDPLGGTLTVVMSPFVARGWRDGSAAKVLNRWAVRGPVVLVPLLPERMWARTALGAALPVQVSAPGPGVANARLRWVRPRSALRLPARLAPPEPAPNPTEPLAIALPLTVLEPDALKRWAAVLADRPGATAPGVLYAPPAVPQPPADAPASPPTAPTAEQRLKQFWLTSSPLAQRLAGLLAASPVSVKVLGVIRTRLLPGAGLAHEAEVLFGGLLHRTSPRGESDPRYEFHKGVRELLLNAARPDDTLSVLEEVSDYLREQFAGGRTFRTVLADPTGAAGLLSAGDSPFAKIAAEVLLRAGGAYAKLVRPAGPPVVVPDPPPEPVKVRTTESESSQAPIRRRRPPAEVGAEAPAPAETATRRAAALVIGISKYATPDVLLIPFAADDAHALAAVLTDPLLCQFPPDCVRLLIDAAATSAAIQQSVDQWLPEVARGAELVVLYVVGHGINGYLLPHDAGPNTPVPVGLAFSALAAQLDELGAQSVVICLDCFHPLAASPYSAPRVLRYLTSQSPPQQLLGTSNRFLMFACKEEQLSLGESADFRHSLFAHHLLKGIEGAGDRDGDGRVGVAELFEYVSDAVARDARALGVERTPWSSVVSSGEAYISTPRPRSEPKTAPPEKIEPSPVPEPLRAMAAEAVEKPDDPLAELNRFLNATTDEAATVELLARVVQLADPRLAAVVVPRLGDRWPEPVRRAARDALKAMGVSATFARIEELARGNDPALGAVLDGLAVLHPRADLVELLSRVADLTSGPISTKAVALRDRKRLGLSMAVLAQKIQEARSPLRLQRVLGRGRFADSYLARDDFLHSDVVVRVLRDEFARDPEIGQRFLSVYRESVQLAHPNLVRTQRVGTLPGGVYYAVRGYIEGATLRSVLDRPGAGFRPDQVVAVLRQLLGALDTLADVEPTGLYHGDVRPSNIVVTAGERFVLGDRGVPGLPVADTADQWVEAYRYTAPEVLLGEPGGSPADLYSLGCVAYELLCGAPPFTANTPRELVEAHRAGRFAPASARRPELGTAVDAFLNRLLNRDPAQRGTPLDALRALEALRFSDTGGESRPTGPH